MHKFITEFVDLTLTKPLVEIENDNFLASPADGQGMNAKLE
jgi:hypothetical protein